MSDDSESTSVRDGMACPTRACCLSSRRRCAEDRASLVRSKCCRVVGCGYLEDVPLAQRAEVLFKPMKSVPIVEFLGLDDNTYPVKKEVRTVPDHGADVAGIAGDISTVLGSHVCLVSMPWQALDTPSLAIGILEAACVTAGLAKPAAYHANIGWAEHLMKHSEGRLTPRQYIKVAENGTFHGLGDWVFAGVLNEDPEFGVDGLIRYAQDRGIDITAVTEMRMFAQSFIEQVVDDILALEPQLVGFTSTFMQNVPSLAAAQLIKQRAPHVSIAFGGANCDGPMGVALQRAFWFVDYVVRGEGEISLPLLIKALTAHTDLSDVPGLCWTDCYGTQQVNANGPLVAADQLPQPQFDDWFGEIKSSPVHAYVQPKLVMETSRGCWWGQVHHCTFCGLNGTAMQFRSKSSSRALSELMTLVRRHQYLDVILVDNIMPHNYFRDFLPRLAELGWDLRLHYELKSNLRDGEAEALRRAHVVLVQPGIESLVSSTLVAMDKGVTATRNVQTLRDLESAGITVSWNWLYGFPGEKSRDYSSVIRQVGALAHLQPPTGAARVSLERFSPYFDRPELGFEGRRAARYYDYLYELAKDDIEDLAYLFDTSSCGLTVSQAGDLIDVIERWIDAYPSSSLLSAPVEHGVLITDRRHGRNEQFYFDDPVHVAVYRLLAEPHTLSGLLRRLEVAGGSLESRARCCLGQFRDRGLVFTESNQYVRLPTTAAPLKMLQ
jgi:ribosomal peptide maturation radical SAM protein 1